MEKLVIVGAQWGDEGKGKIVDLLSKDYALRGSGLLRSSSSRPADSEKVHPRGWWLG